MDNDATTTAESTRIIMKKQNDRQSNGNKSALKDTGPTTSPHVHREAAEGNILSEGALERIRARAYSLFQLRGQQPGHALDDWLLAEREVLRQSPSRQETTP